MGEKNVRNSLNFLSLTVENENEKDNDDDDDVQGNRNSEP